MATLRVCGSRDGATSFVCAVTACIAAAGAMRAQTFHPFADATAIPAISLTQAACAADVNRDGSPDMIVPGVFFGSLVTTLDESGAALAVNSMGPGLSSTLRSSVWPRPIALAAGLLDGDGIEDLVTVSAAGSVHFHRNLGATSISASNFAPDVIVDVFAGAHPINPPFVSYWFPCIEVVDLDGDGHQDVLIGGGPNDSWGGASQPGFVGYYRGDGLGGFQTFRHALAGGVVDLEFADLDGDGARDTVVVLVETGTTGAFGYELVHLRWQHPGFQPIGFPQPVGPGRPVALEVFDVLGDANADYVLAQVVASNAGMGSAVYCFQGDGLGNASSSAWAALALPANTTGLGDFVCSIQADDFDRDGHVDLAMLRGYVQGASAGSLAPPVFADCDVLIAMGPALPNAPIEVVPLPGHLRFSSTSSNLFAQRPLQAVPDALLPLDLGRDACTDFVVTGLRASTATGQPVFATLQNLTVPLAGDARFEKVGAASGGLASRPARIGFDGGRPRPGNASFACTVQNLQAGSVVGLMWGSWATPNLFTMHGLDFHFAPEEFGFAGVASGTTATNGFFSYPLPIPAVPALVGDAGYFQYNYFDPVLGVFGGTQATGLWIGS